MLSLHRDKKIVRRELRRNGKVIRGHRQDDIVEAHQL